MSCLYLNDIVMYADKQRHELMRPTIQQKKQLLYIQVIKQPNKTRATQHGYNIIISYCDTSYIIYLQPDYGRRKNPYDHVSETDNNAYPRVTPNCEPPNVQTEIVVTREKQCHRIHLRTRSLTTCESPTNAVA